MRPDRDALAAVMAGPQASPVLSGPGDDDLLFDWMNDLTRGLGQKGFYQFGSRRHVGPETEPLTREIFRQNLPAETYPSMPAIEERMRQEYLRRMQMGQ